MLQKTSEITQEERADLVKVSDKSRKTLLKGLLLEVINEGAFLM